MPRRMELSVVDGVATADGQVLTPPPGVDPAAALIQHAQGVAADVGTVLAHVRDGTGTDMWLSIASDGVVSPAQAPPEEVSPPATAPPTTLSAWSAPAAGSSPLSARVGRSRKGTAVDRRTVLFAGGGLAALTLAGAGVWALNSSGKKAPPTPAPSPSPSSENSRPSLPDGQFPPAGWSSEARWVIPNLADPHPAVAVRDGLVSVATQVPGTGRLAITTVREDSGKQVWQQALAAGTVITDGPYLIRRDSLMVMIATQTEFIAWDAHSGAQKIKAKLPHQSASVGFSLLGPWINEKGQRFQGLTRAGLKPFDIPNGASCFGSVGDQLIALKGNQVWKLTYGKPRGKPTALQGPKGRSVGAVAAITDSLVVLGWNQDKSTALRAYDVHSLKPKWTTSAQSNWSPLMNVTLVSPDQTWATAGNRRVDLRNGAVSVIASSWKPVGISDEFAWGDDGTYILTSSKNGALVSGKPSHPTSQTVQVCAGAGKLALVSAGVADSYSLFALGTASGH